MTKLFEINVNLSENQKKNISDAYRNRETIVIRLTNDSLSGSDTLLVPATVKKRLEKNRKENKGMDIKLPKTNIRKQVGGRKKEGKRYSARPKQSLQQNSITRSYFVNKPLSNYDIKDWVKQLGIKHFRGVFSKDVLPTQIKNKECGIVNLDNHIGPGTHWVAYRNIDRFCEYFDSFGLMMPSEVKKYMATSGKQLEYSGDEIQERDSVLCGYWCLYYLLERQKGRSILDTIHNSKFNIESYCVKQKKQTECVEPSGYKKAKNGQS